MTDHMEEGVVYVDHLGRAAGVPAAQRTLRCCTICRRPCVGVNHTVCRERRRSGMEHPELRTLNCDSPDCADHFATAPTIVRPCGHIFCYESAQRYNVTPGKRKRCPKCFKRIQIWGNL